MTVNITPQNPRLFLILLITISSSFPGIAQDPEFTQFYANPMYLNPAFAGSAQAGRVGINFRNQWDGIDNAFRTFSASYDQYAAGVAGGLGIQFIHDGAGTGTYHSNSIVGVYAYQTALNTKYNLNFGGKVGFTDKSIKWGEMTFGDMIDPDQGFVFESSEIKPRKSRGYLDLSVGALMYSKNTFAGVAVNHLHEPVTSLVGDYRLSRRYSFHAGTNIRLGDQFTGEYTLSPNLLYTKQGEFEQLNVGIYLQSGVVTAGVWYRSTDAIILLFGVKTAKYGIGYSYDMTISLLTMASGGAHELSFVLRLPRKTPHINYKQIPCAVF